MASNEGVNCLMEMGFSKERSELAYAATTGKGLQAAIDWLLQHPEDSVGHTLGGTSSEAEPMNTGSGGQTLDADKKEGATTENPAEVASDGQTPQQALSLVCEECGKQLRSEMDAQAHAARSGHQKFAESSEEIRPLTEEEKKQQLEMLQKKMADRRKEREEGEKEDNRKREISRRKTGKQVTDAKHKHEMAELKKIAEEKRREKQEEKLLRQKLKLKIAQDRANRKMEQTGSKVSLPASSSVDGPKLEVKKQEAKDYDTCRIQLRFPNGQASTGSFKPTDLLSIVCDYAVANGYNADSPISLMTTFPRKTFSSADMSKTLLDLGLVPSSVIIITKS